MVTLEPFSSRVSSVDAYAQPMDKLIHPRGNEQEAGTTTSFSPDEVLATETPTSTVISSNPGIGMRHGVSQSVLEWIFAVIALAVLTVLVVWRYNCIRYSRRSGVTAVPFSLPSLRRPAPAQTQDRYTTAEFLQPGFLPFELQPAAPGTRGARRTRRPRVRVRGLDVGTGGRRGGGDSVDDLPPYELGKRPPKYAIAGLGVAPGQQGEHVPPPNLHAEPPRNSSNESPQEPTIHTPAQNRTDEAQDWEISPLPLESSPPFGYIPYLHRASKFDAA